MVTEDYVSFETAKLLKEKGFDGECDYLYADGKILRASWMCNWNRGETLFTDYKNECSAPTLQMAMKWLREVHKLNIATFPTSQTELVAGKGFVRQYSCDIFNDNEFVKSLEIVTGYEKACETAIKYCLENLI